MGSEAFLLFVELSTFHRRWDDYGLDDRDLRTLQNHLMHEPTQGKVIRGTGGLRKMRFSRPERSEGKSGGFRICYAYFPEFGVIFLVLIYAKNELDEIPKDQKASIRKMLDRARDRLNQGSYRLNRSSEE